MGVADVIPGVSGGSVAFITGIYDEMVHSLRSIDREAVEPSSQKFKIAGFLEKDQRKFSSRCLCRHCYQFVYARQANDYLLQSIIPFGLVIFFRIDSDIGAACSARHQEMESASWYCISCRHWHWRMASPCCRQLKRPNALWFIFLAGMLASVRIAYSGYFRSLYTFAAGKISISSSMHSFRFKYCSSLLYLCAGCVVGLFGFSRFLAWTLR